MGIPGCPLWSQSSHTGPSKNRDRVGVAGSLVLASPQELPALIGSSQQMVPEGQMAIQKEHLLRTCPSGFPLLPCPSLRCLKKVHSVLSRSQTPVQNPGLAIRE